MDKIHRRLIGKARLSAHSAIIYQAAGVLVFVILGIVIYSNTLNSPFVFDDLPNIQDNPQIRLTELTLRNIITAAFKSHASYRPVANISFALNYYFHQYDVAGYHCTNITIHILTAIFLYLFLKNTLSVSSLRSRYGNYKQIAYFAALIWLVHPVQTQSVTYIVQRMNSLAAMFYILSMLLYVKGRLANNQHNRSWLWFTGCILSGVLAVGSKQIAATLPVFILLYEWYFFQDLNTSWLKRYLIYVIVLFAAFGILALLYLGPSPFERILSSYRRRDFTLIERLLTQPRVVVHYISLLFYPHPGRLNLDYGFAIYKSLISPVTTLPCIGVILGLLVLAVCMVRKERLLSFCILWFFGNLAIESSVLGLEIAFEHRLYLPSMLACLVVAALAWRYIRQGWVRVTVFSIVIVLFCTWTYQRNNIWSDAVTLWRDCVAKSPNKARPYNNLGKEFHVQDKLDEAISYYDKAIQIRPNFAEAHSNLGSALAAQDKLDEAITHYHKALQIKPDYVNAHYNLATALTAHGKLDEAISHYCRALHFKPSDFKARYNLGVALETQGKLDEAITHYRKALQYKPDFAKAHNNLGNALKARGKLDEAIRHYHQALQIDPDYAESHYNLGMALADKGKPDEAMTHYRLALQNNPDYVKAHNNLADALVSKGKFADAIEHYRHALRLKPDWLGSLNNLAWILGTHKDSEFHNAEQAITLSEQACKLTNYKVPALLDTLAVAYAAAGRFSKAVSVAEKALELAESSKQKELAKQIRERLGLYKSGQQYVEPPPKISPD